MDGKTIPVKVAVRGRPLLEKEISEGCRPCITFIENEPQVVIGTDKAFTFDFTYPPKCKQEMIYDDVVKPLVQSIFNGYNATVLAYGQTGSGKTYSMGTAFDSSLLHDNNESAGIIPRVVKDIFSGINERNSKDFYVKVTFLEIYKEDVLDLLSNNKRSKEELTIREDHNGELKVTNLTEFSVSSVEETFRCLEQGSSARSTGATAMNQLSSRSHAVFTLHLEQSDGDMCIRSKFHLVDLAGSERVKKTRAQGDRFKEGVNINKGLLSLGNVISALCEGKNRSHVPYRDSKLTRLLQDSLGGNSHTAMIACISPADSNMEETLNTLRYADRARKIKNKPIVNTDPNQAEIMRLKNLVQQLQVGGTSLDHTSCEEQKKLLEVEIRHLTKDLQIALGQTTKMYEKALLAETARDRLNKKLSELSEKTGVTVDLLNQSLNISFTAEMKDQLDAMKDVHDKVVDLQIDNQINEDEQNCLFEVSDSEDQEDGNEMEETETPRGLYVKAHTMKQAEMNRELHELNRALALKEDLVNKMKTGDDKFDILKQQYEDNLEKLQEKIEKLEREKNRILQNPALNKTGEPSVKKVQDLEKEISTLKLKLTEQSKIKKLKEQSDEKVKKLHDEIQVMKQTRVKLIRQMKEEADKFRQWKQTKDREVAKLKQQDRRRQFEIVRMEQTHSKQQNVMRRKMEEALAANKRLKDALAVRQSAAEKRMYNGREQRHLQRIQAWMKQELEIISSAKEAKHCLQYLINDRKAIAEELIELKKKVEEDEPPTKKLSGKTNEVLNASGDELTMVKSRIVSLEKDQELRSIQIGDLQQKIIDADQDDKRDKWDSIQSMSDAKQALKWIFDEAANCRVEKAFIANDLKEEKKNSTDSERKVKHLEQEIKRIRLNHEEDLVRVAQENQEKVIFLLRQIPNVFNEESGSSTECDISVKERLEFAEREINNLSGIYDEFQKKAAEVETLKRELSKVQMFGNGKKVPLMPQLCDFSGSPVFPATPHHKKKPIVKKSVSIHHQNLFALEEDEDDDVSGDDDDSEDPDWCQSPAQGNSRNGNLDNTRKKRSSESKCSCKSSCGTMRCSCRKGNRVCSKTCGCESSKCTNREDENEDSRLEDSEGDSTFIKSSSKDESNERHTTFTKSPSTAVGRQVLSIRNRLESKPNVDSSVLNKAKKYRKRSKLHNPEDFFDSD